ncbi:MAG: AsmA family protein [Bradyrhizobium sp.]|uniref:AsmA family protein n=1 Tax=Bradyrhizobium sp. TaxID=376 RepID=UPI001214987D|nr:AsmA family protein [Bradyrhizobium sp.]THD60356.1 MAG: AsmA family protein [Bradyrhizobium sp.]
MKALKIAGAAIAAVIIAAVLLLIIGIPSGFLTSTIKDQVERETGYRLTINGATKIGLWPSLHVTLHDLTLEDPQQRDTSKRLTVGSVEADVTLGSVWSGHPQVTELAIVHPTVYVPLLRERTAAPIASSPPPTSSGKTDTKAFAIDHVTVTDGTAMFSNVRDRVNSRIDSINADVRIGGDRRITINGSAGAGDRPLKFGIKATVPALPLERQNIPVELTLEDPNLLQAPLSAKAEVRLNGSVAMINGLTGTIGDGAFNGWASVDLTSKPLVKVDLDFQRLAVAMPAAATPVTSQTSQQGWSSEPTDVNRLNYIDLQVRISAAELNIGTAHFAPAAIDATLASGVLKADFANLGAYDGQASGQLIVDVSSGNPAYTLRCDLAGVGALPLLKSAADFDKLDGKMQAKIVANSSGNSQLAIVSNLSGTVFAIFQDGAIRGLNVAQMVRSLTSGTLSGWQEGKEQATDLAQLSASFRIDKGQATTTDLNLVGPLVKMTGAGTIDLIGKQMAFRVEPKLVMTTEGQGRASDPVGLGVPVIIDGPWAQPRIYPEMSGIFDNPDAAYAKLREMGKGLFAGGALGNLGNLGGTGSGGGTDQSGALSGKLGETLGNLLQGLGQNRSLPDKSSDPAAPPAAAPPPAQSDVAPPPSQDSQPMNDVLKQLFKR